LDEGEGLSVDLDEAFACLAVGDGGCCLLLAELYFLLMSPLYFLTYETYALNTLRRSHGGWYGVQSDLWA
jgi:hypothetical protein